MSIVVVLGTASCGAANQVSVETSPDGQEQTSTGAISAEAKALTRADAQKVIYQTATKYVQGVTEESVLKNLPEKGGEETVTRGELLTMLSNAFAEFPEPKGDNLRRAAGVAEYTDVPEWATSAIANLNRGQLLVPAEDKLLKPDEIASEQELDTYLRRIYALYGTRLEDDFYTAVNKEWLDQSEETASYTGTMKDLEKKINSQIGGILDEILKSNPEKGTPERKIIDYYQSYTDKKAQNKIGAAPLKPYLKQLSEVKDIKGLNAALATLASETAYFPYVKFQLSADYQDGKKNSIYLKSGINTMPPENLSETIDQAFKIAGVDNPAETAKLAEDIQTRLVEACKDVPDLIALEDEEQLAHNRRISMEEIKALVPGADIDALLAATGLKPETEYIVREDAEGALKELGKLYTDENAPALAALAQYRLIDEYKNYMGDLFAEKDAEPASQEALEEEAKDDIKSVFQSYLGQLYGQRYSSEKVKEDVTKLVKDFIEIFKDRVQKLDWMSDSTKAAAIKKLDNITLQIAYPDEPDDLIDGFEVGDPRKGGSHLGNQVALWKRRMQQDAAWQGKPVSTNIWRAAPYIANAYGDLNLNGIGIPAGFLQAPIYNPDATAEEKMAGIGWIIAHEITHLFDPTGAQYNETGGFVNWWTDEDKQKFGELGTTVLGFYAGLEIAPGLVGKDGMTMIEDIADLGGMACALDLLKKQKAEPDYALFFKQVAEFLRSTADRSAYESFTGNTHTTDRNRVNALFKTFPEFYEAFDIQEGDGMYVPADKRVKVW